MKNISKYSSTSFTIHKEIVILFYISIFLLISNIFLVWRVSSSYVQGHFIDYLAPKIYVSQVFVVLLTGIFLLFTGVATRGRPSLSRFFGLLRSWLNGWPLLLGIFCIIFLFQAIGWKDLGLLSLVSNFVVGPVLFGILLWKHKSLTQLHLYPALLIATTFQASLGILQWIQQKSVFGYWFFGEPVLSSPGVTLSSLPGAVRILPYGTTPHPNILAAWLVLGILVLLLSWKKILPVRSYFSTLVQIGILGLHLCALLLSESWVAWMSLVLLLLYTYAAKQQTLRTSIQAIVAIFTRLHAWKRKSVLLFLFLLFQAGWSVFPLAAGKMPFIENMVSDTSLTRRWQLQQSSFELIESRPSGTGFRAVIQHIFHEERSYVGSRFLQPPHNSLILLLTVGGFWITIVFLLYMYVEHDLYSLFTLLFLCTLPLFTLDHYFVSSISGQFLFILYYYFLRNTNSQLSP